MGIDDELKERFMALKVLANNLHGLEEEEQKDIHKMEIEFEKKYKEVYDRRE